MVSLQRLARAVLPRGVRNWIRAPRKSLDWGWQQTRFLLGQRDQVELRPGLRLLCHPLVYRHSYFAQAEDAEQAAEFDSFLAHCTPGMVLFDIGAHFGLFALAALHYGGPTSRAVAVDASPAAARMIQTQARLNQVQERLSVTCACVCDAVGTRDMVAIGPLADGYYTPPTPTTPRSEMSATPAITLDGLVAQTGLRPTHVKIDVEGCEESVLRGGVQLLTGAQAPLLFLELHNALCREQGKDPSAVLALLDAAGYHTFDVSGAPVEHAALLRGPLVRLVAKKPWSAGS
jgi:FkbM family methyltransferase